MRNRDMSSKTCGDTELSLVVSLYWNKKVKETYLFISWNVPYSRLFCTKIRGVITKQPCFCTNTGLQLDGEWWGKMLHISIQYKGKYCSVAFISMVTLEEFIHSLKPLKHLVHYNKQHHRKVLLNSSNLNGHTLGTRPQT